jgi:Uma2 family endonuclease
MVARVAVLGRPKFERIRPHQRFVLFGVDWETYDRLLRAFGTRRIRLTYEEGTLEIMTLSSQHERLTHLLGLLIVTLAEVLGKDIAGYGSLTMRRRDRERGLEPDECFWIQHALRMRNIKRFSLRRDPSPDLALEIDVSRSVLARMPIYAALRVPEVWRWGKGRVELNLLDQHGEYRPAKLSRAFPSLEPEKLGQFLELAMADGEVAMLRAFRSWIKKNLV